MAVASKGISVLCFMKNIVSESVKLDRYKIIFDISWMWLDNSNNRPNQVEIFGQV